MPEAELHVLNSARWHEVFLRIDGRTVTQANAAGSGIVNCQFMPGAYELLWLHIQEDGSVAIESAHFPNVFLRMDGSGVPNQATGPGSGTVNCQRGIGSYEKFKLNPQPNNMVAI